MEQINQTAQIADTSARHGVIGIFASIFSWLVGAFSWYSAHLNVITSWAVHIAQIGGLVVMVYSILILRRNWKTGSNSTNPQNK